jgi:hypothetical protein
VNVIYTVTIITFQRGIYVTVIGVTRVAARVAVGAFKRELGFIVYKLAVFPLFGVMTVAAAIAERVLMNIIVGMAVDTLVCRIAKGFVIIVT